MTMSLATYIVFAAFWGAATAFAGDMAADALPGFPKALSSQISP